MDMARKEFVDLSVSQQFRPKILVTIEIGFVGFGTEIKSQE